MHNPRTALVLAACLLAGSAVWAAEPDPQLEKELQAMAQAHRGKVAFYARHLGTGATVALDADTPVPTASVIKLPLMLEYFAQVKAGKRNPAEKVTLVKEEQVPGSGVLTALGAGLELTLEDAVVLMMVLSDNTATNLVIDKVGLEPMNRRMAEMGLKNTVFYKKVFKPAEGPMPEDQPKFGLGKTTAREMAQVLESIHACKLEDEALCARMLQVLRQQQHRNMIPRYLEVSNASVVRSRIGNKTGSLNAVRNDVALIETASGPIIISAFTYENEDRSWLPDNQAELLIGRMARAIVQAWAPAGVAEPGP